MDNTTLTNQFLIAMPNMDEPNFSHTVTYICMHNDEGALGIIINRPLEITLKEVFEQMKSTPQSSETTAAWPVYMGGPVQPDRGFVLHPPGQSWESMMQISPEICVTTSRDIIDALAAGSGPERALVALGYAGWGAGQLEQELAANAWFNAPADAKIIFDTPVQRRWQAAAALTGVDLNRLSDDVGHA